MSGCLIRVRLLELLLLSLRFLFSCNVNGILGCLVVQVMVLFGFSNKNYIAIKNTFHVSHPQQRIATFTCNELGAKYLEST